MKTRNTFRRSLICKLVTFRLIILMIEMVCGAGMVQSVYAVHYNPATHATMSGSEQHVVDACGPLCLLIVALIIIGVVSVIIVGLLKMCKLLDKAKKAPSKPDDPDSRVAPAQWFISGLEPTMKAFRSNLSRTVELRASEQSIAAYDITGTNGDGSTNDVYLDRSGDNQYCVMFTTTIQSTTNLNDWSNPVEEVTVKGWISYAPGYRSATSTVDPTKTEIIGQTKNVLVVCYTNGVAVSRVYYPSSQRTGIESSIVIPPSENVSKKFFRLALPSD